MKKIFLSLMIGFLVLGLATGCGNNNNNSSNNNPDTNNDINVNDTNQNNNLPEHITENLVRNYKVTPASDFEYEETDGGIKIKKYKGNDLIVVIPESINGKPVVELKSYIFANNSDVKGIYLPKTIEKLKYTFINNDDIQVVIAEGIEQILDNVFANCKSLHTVVLDDSLQELGYFAFTTLPNLKEVYISANMNKITEELEGSVFHECPNLTIKGKSGSYIETYANKHNIRFEAN